jgi:acetolactate synthase-1/2/3 large subunit
MTTMRVADYIMQRLVDAGIRHVFQVTGRGALFLNDALAKHEALEAVSLHHEQSCAFAAVGYAQQTGGLGACLVSTGCAATNTITGVLSAWQDGIPCVFVSGQNTLRETSRHTGIPLRTYGQQEADIVALVQGITKFSRMVTRADEIVEAMDRALQAATTGRKGPVWIDVPLDLQSALIDPSAIATTAPLPVDLPQATRDAVAAVVDALAGAQRPVVLVGSGVRSAGAEGALRRFVERWQLPVTFAASATDTYGTAHPLAIGSVGAMACSRAGNFAVQNADLVLVLGSRLTSLTTGTDACKFARAARVIVVDIDAVEHSKESIRIDRFVHAELAGFLSQLEDFEPKPASAAWTAKCRHWKALFAGVEPAFQGDDGIDLYQLAEALSETLPAASTLVTDSGLAELILPTNVRFAPGMQCVHPASQGAMGFALPAAIGAQYGQDPSGNDRCVLAVIGDGSIMMNLQEFESIRHRRLPIKVIVVNNNVYAIIRRRQKELFRRRTIGTDPTNGVSCPEFAKVAACFGIDYMKIETTGQLRAGLADLLAREGPVLCELMGRAEQGYIELGHARSVIDRRLVRRPLEDQEPFLPRELFLAEMIVDPIDQ